MHCIFILLRITDYANEVIVRILPIKPLGLIVHSLCNVVAIECIHLKGLTNRIEQPERARLDRDIAVLLRGREYSANVTRLKLVHSVSVDEHQQQDEGFQNVPHVRLQPSVLPLQNSPPHLGRK